MMKLTHILSLLLFSLIKVYSSEDELRSLMEFRKGIREDPLGKIDSWRRSSADPNSCPSSFYGVVCDGAGNVSAIALDGLGLVGELKFVTLTGLKMLKNLSLSGNSLTGRLVPALGSLSTLQHLDLSGNQFYGPIPGRINDLWGLNYLDLSSNNFAGRFPTGIQNLQQLKMFDLGSNKFDGDIQELFIGLRNVERVDLSNNMFFGSLAMDLQNIASLANTVQYLNLSNNKLGGGFFHNDAILLFRNLKVLDLGGNHLSGELPSFQSLPNLRVLRLPSNQLSGAIPEELLESLIPLEELDLSDNAFSGPIHQINSTTLTVLNLSSNGLSGSLPSSIGRCLIVDLSRNMLSGDVSGLQNWEASLEILDLSSNGFSGIFPNLTSKFQALTTLILKNNSLAGSLPPLLGSYPSLSVIDLSSNQLDGPIPPSLFSSTTLTSLNLSGNHLIGPIPLQGPHTSELLVLPSYPPMEFLDLSDNGLTGDLPSGISNFGRLKLLSLAKNRLSGNLPDGLSKLSDLEYLDLSNNDFKGEIPDKLPSSLNVFNVSYNDLTGAVPGNLKKFPATSFRPGNPLLVLPDGMKAPTANNNDNARWPSRRSKSSAKVAIIVAAVVAALMLAFILLAYRRAKLQDFRINGLNNQTTDKDVKLGKLSKPSLFKFHKNVESPPSYSFSDDHLLTSNSRSLSAQPDSITEIVEHVFPEGGEPANGHLISGRKSSPGSPVTQPPLIDSIDQPLTLNSPDRLAGELYFLDASLGFTAEDLSRAPAEVLGRSSHGTLYKATLDSGHVLTVKWLRVGLVKRKKEFAKEVRKIGSVRHPSLVPLRAYYWGPREQERLILADFVMGDSMSLHLYESTPRRYSRLSFNQRLKIAVDVAQCLTYLHDRGVPHGNLKPTNILLIGSDLSVRLTDYGLHRLMTPDGVSEQILNLGALGYCAPELTAAKPTPSLKADVYAFGVILMELLTRKSAGDIISGQAGAVDLTDWVQMCDNQGRGMDCIDRDIAARDDGGGDESGAMDELLAISLRCILPASERPSMKHVLEDLRSISG